MGKTVWPLTFLYQSQELIFINEDALMFKSTNCHLIQGLIGFIFQLNLFSFKCCLKKGNFLISKYFGSVHELYFCGNMPKKENYLNFLKLVFTEIVFYSSSFEICCNSISGPSTVSPNKENVSVPFPWLLTF